MKKSWLLGIAIPVLFVLAWWLGFRFYGEGDTPRLQTNTPITVTSVESTSEAVQAADAARDAVQDDVESAVEAEDAVSNNDAEGPETLNYIGWEIDEQSRDARACFAFGEPLQEAENLEVRDYITIRPSFKFSQTVSGNDLCISGFDYANDYTVTIKQGLKGTEDRKLKLDIVETVSFGDKPKYVGFTGQGIILPRIGAQGLGIETVNIDVLEIEVARVTDRMIARRNPQVGESVMEGDYGWVGEDAATQIRSVIWEGKVDVKSVRNEMVKTILPVSDMVGELLPGAYIVSAKRKHDDDEYEYARAWRWVIVTDLAITSYRGQGGMDIGVRSIDSAKIKSGIDVLLIAQNNEILATSKTDSTGHTKFAAPLFEGKGNKAAKMILAYGAKQDFAMLDLSRAPVDMSDHDIAGRNAGDAVDIYGFAERGVYRPGETAHFTVMLRDQQARAILDRDTTLTVRRPNGIEISSHRVEAKDLSANLGVINWAYEIPNSAPRGNWSLNIKTDGSDSSKRVGFAVEDFVPQKLKLTLKSDDAPIKSGEMRDVSVDAQFLYGAPGGALNAEAEARIRLDYQPFKDLNDYQFGPQDKNFRERYMDMGTAVTDGAGLATFALDFKNDPVSAVWPLRAEIVAGVAEPGGRYIQEALQIPIRSEDYYVGIANGYDSSRIPENQPAKFKILAVDASGKPIAKDLSWKLVREDWDYHWYRENGRWRYRYDTRDHPIATGQIKVGANAPANWSHRIDYGRHRLEIRDGDTVLASRKFWAGWGRSTGASEAPDSLELNTVNEMVQAGDTVRLKVNAPYEGLGEVVIASDRVHSVQPLLLNKGTSEISFKFDKSWGDSVYALVTLYTPRDIKDRPVPRRAVGVSYVALDRSAQTFNLEIETPDVIRPRREHVFSVKVDGPANRDKVMMNFAAVDEGILQITKFKSPDASGHYFGKKALGIQLWDDYGRILNPNLGAPTKLRSGGDSLGGEGLTVVPTKTVAMFQGLVSVRNGKVEVKLDIPDFNGELRLMATAWGKEALGSTSTPVKVRDQVPAIVAMPRFLAPGDEALMTVSLDNVEGSNGRYAANARSGNVVKAGNGLTFDLEQGERKQDRVSLSASRLGIETINHEIEGPGSYKVSSEYPIQVRSPYYPITQNKLVELGPGETVSLGPDWVDNFVPEGTDVSVSFTKLPGIDPAPIVGSLRKYPYGCTEQTVSTALPLIYAGDLGGIPGQTDIARRRAVQAAIYKISNRMSVDGAFGLWRSGDRYARAWVGIYATDFLYRAKAQGYYVPEDVLDRATKALSEISRMPRYSGLRYYKMRDRSDWYATRRAEDAAYAHYVLALNEQGDLGKARYHFDNHVTKMATPLSVAYLGGALQLMGDERRASRAFDMMADQLDHRDNRDYYYSKLRDMAGFVAIASESGARDLAMESLEDLGRELRNKRYTNTQEKGYLIMAFKAIMKDSSPANISVDNISVPSFKGSPIVNLYGSDLGNNPGFTNKGDETIWASVTIDGPPINAPEPSSTGFNISKALFTPDGMPLNGRAIKQGEKLVVKLSYQSTEYWRRSVVIADLLPAGFEIENVLLPADGNRKDGLPSGPFAWAGNISPLQVSEKRDDRFVASLNTRNKDRHVTAYVVRAVTPGTFTMPGVVIEDMYRPQDHAITEAGKITITSDPSL